MIKQSQPEPQVSQTSTCENGDCCSTTEDGYAVCSVSKNPEAISGIDISAATIQIESIETRKLSPLQPKRFINVPRAEQSSTWQKIKGVALFGIACLASPCCTPLYVPVILALLAGTPAALWLDQNLGWVYGGLTLVSLVSFVLAWRLMGKNGSRRAPTSHLQSSISSEAPIK